MVGGPWGSLPAWPCEKMMVGRKAMSFLEWYTPRNEQRVYPLKMVVFPLESRRVLLETTIFRGEVLVFREGHSSEPLSNF